MLKVNYNSLTELLNKMGDFFENSYIDREKIKTYIEENIDELKNNNNNID